MRWRPLGGGLGGWPVTVGGGGLGRDLIYRGRGAARGPLDHRLLLGWAARRSLGLDL